MTRARRTSPAYWLCVGGMVATLVGVTLFSFMQELESDVWHGITDNWFETRIALSMMDAWLAPILAAEVARPPADFEPTATPHALLSAEPGLFRLYFTVDASDAWYAPTTATAELDWLQHRVTAADLRRFATSLPASSGGAPAGDAARHGTATEQPSQRARDLQSAEDFRLRQNAVDNAFAQQGTAIGIPPALAPRAFVPVWLRADAGHPTDELVLVRTDGPGPRKKVLGILIDWPVLKAALLAQSGVDHDGSGMDLVPAPDGTSDAGRLARAVSMLATAPISIRRSPAAMDRRAVRWRHDGAHAALVAAWLAGIGSMFVLSRVLRSSNELAERRGRFVSAVTHELRTPLTTFRMYAEMLAQNMVPDEATRREYLATLEAESGRLARVVESVLLYARLEEGKGGARRRHIATGALLDRCIPVLERRAVAGGMTLAITSADAARQAVVDADAQAVEQILHNLVDNACKYAASGDDHTIGLVISATTTDVTLTVTDAGPGVPPAEHAAIFEPFRRATRDDPGPVPGAGLGLAIARSLARALDGDLVLHPTARGATFRLTLPRVG